MATQLVDSLAGEWDPRQYHDTYTEELRQRIKDKQAGKELTRRDGAGGRPAKVST